MRNPYKELRNADKAFRNLSYLCPKNKTKKAIMDTTVIIAIIISTIAALGVVILVILLFYYHWRNQELLVNFSAFIRENLKLKDEIDNLRNSESKSNISINK